MSATLKRKIRSKKAHVAVVGLGYVGLPLALSFAKGGFPVVGVDTDQDRVNSLSRGKSYITDIKDRELQAVLKPQRFQATTDISVLAKMDVIIICVPTPLKRKYTPDISFIVGAVRSVQKFLKKDTLVILESTTYPGTTKELILPELEKSGLRNGKDFYLAFSPERIDPGNKQYHVTEIPKVVGGLTPEAGELTQMLYGSIIKHVHRVSSAEAAEMTKLLENSFRIINIGWINEVAVMCHTLGIDVWEVIDAAKTKPFGFMPFYPGLGVGGHCIPEDPLYLYWKAKQYGFSSKYIKLSADTNSQMPAYVIERLQEILRKDGKSLNSARILVMGVTYKKDVKDLRKSPSLKLIELLKESQAHVDYHDPFIPYLKMGGLQVDPVALTKENVVSYDCVVIATDHTQVDYQLILNSAKKIFDIRNVYAKVKNREKISKL